MDKLVNDLKLYEGYREEVYLDHLGNPTCGWGHHLYVGSKVTALIADEFLRGDIAVAVSEYYKLDKKYRKHLNPNRARVIVHMIFVMGLPRVFRFVNMLSAIEAEDWERAGKEIINSKFAEQVGKRAVYLADAMLRG